MKTILKRFLAALLLYSLASGLLPAQTPSSNGAGANPSAPPPSVSIDRMGLHIVGEPNSGEVKLSNGVLIQNLVAILGFFGTIVAVVGVIAHARNRQKTMLHETLRAMIEKGAAIPPELIAKPSRARPPGHDLRWGLVLAAFGIGVRAWIGKVGFIFLFIGLAFLIVWLVERRNRNNEPA